MVIFALAVSLPPHARMTSKCYSVWNSDHSDLDVVWHGTIYNHGFHSFNTQPNANNGACFADSCVERLWCTDSGAVGWYAYSSENGLGVTIPLVATWLGHTSPIYRKTLNETDKESGESMIYTNPYAQGTIAVAGDTLYFYIYGAEFGGGPTTYSLPRLSGLTFSEWHEGKTANELVTESINALNILGYHEEFCWNSFFSPIYPSGPAAVTVSVNDYEGCDGETGDAWAIDAVIRNGATTALVFYGRTNYRSVAATSREVATFPGYSCRALLNGSVVCASMNSGRYTWESEPRTALGWEFTPLHNVL